MRSPSITIACLLLAACTGDPDLLPSSPGRDTATAPLDLDGDGDGYVASEDCDDTDADVSPAAVEVCDGIDNDCDVFVDEGDAADTLPWHQDADEDGFGDIETEPTYACTAPTGRVASSDDCDDYDDSVHPDSREVCDGRDNDCDGLTDSQDSTLDLTTATTWYRDRDQDRYGDPGELTIGCSQPTGYIDNSSDCDDTDADISPEAAEICDGKDNDCDGDTDADDSDIDACLAARQ